MSLRISIVHVTLLAAALLMSLAFQGCAFHFYANSRAIFTPGPPPATKDDPRNERPSHKHVWIDGYWHFEKDENDWHWRSGKWQLPPDDGATWVAPEYGQSMEDHYYVPGYWQRTPRPKTTVEGKRKTITITPRKRDKAVAKEPSSKKTSPSTATADKGDADAKRTATAKKSSDKSPDAKRTATVKKSSDKSPDAKRTATVKKSSDKSPDTDKTDSEADDDTSTDDETQSPPDRVNKREQTESDTESTDPPADRVNKKDTSKDDDQSGNNPPGRINPRNPKGKKN